MVEFDHETKTAFELTLMDAAGKTMASEKLKQLDEGGGTNIRHGLKEACNVLERGVSSSHGRLAHVAHQEPDSGSGVGHAEHVGLRQGGEQIACNRSRLRRRICYLPLLTEIVGLGDGTYSFIPDPGLVLTVFINTRDTVLCTFDGDLRLQVAHKRSCGEVAVMAAVERGGS